ncbi:unnamed protein product [Rotaria sp. Silwood2]|nr:unnamed protein product [Rotaria sp. Silwood2]
MIKDAEKYRDEDKKQHERILAKNLLESYCFNMKTTINDDKISSKLSINDKSKINDIIESTLTWMDSNKLAEKDEFEHKQKEIEAICSPIMAKLYSNQNDPSSESKQKGPTIEEVD